MNPLTEYTQCTPLRSETTCLSFGHALSPRRSIRSESIADLLTYVATDRQRMLDASTSFSRTVVRESRTLPGPPKAVSVVQQPLCRQDTKATASALRLLASYHPVRSVLLYRKGELKYCLLLSSLPHLPPTPLAIQCGFESRALCLAPYRSHCVGLSRNPHNALLAIEGTKGSR